MRYLLMIYSEAATTPPPREEVDKVMAEYWDYEKAVRDAGVRIDSDALRGVESATVVDVRENGERVVTDGPFAETREVLGGYYVLDVPDLDAAIEWAARCPGARHGRIEVRPGMQFPEPDGL